MAVVMALLVGQGVSWASWISSGSGSSSLVTAGTLGVPGLPSPSQAPGGKTVSITWGAVSSATNYVVFYYTAAVGGVQTTACSTSGLSCVDPNARVAYVPDVATSVAISALGADSGSSGSDFITNVAGNTLTGTSEAGALIVIRRGGSQIATATANGSGNWTSSSFTLDEELQNLDATATDAYANTETATRSNVRLDTVAPTTSQAATCATSGNPALTGNWCKQTFLTMTATYGDAGSGLQSGTSQYNDNGVGWLNYAIPVSLAEANGRVVQLCATDIAGNIGTSSGTYYIDGTAPNLTVSQPTAGVSLSLAILTPLLTSTCGGKAACGASSDATSGLASVTSVKWKLTKGGSTCYGLSGALGSCTGYAFQDASGRLPNWTTPLNSPYAQNKDYVLTVQSTDVAGNVRAVTVSFSTIV